MNNYSSSLLRLLVELTTPIEGLACIETSKRNTSKNIIVHELEQLLYSVKEAFLDGKATLAVLRHLHHLLEQVTLQYPCYSISNLHFLLSNRCRATTVYALMIHWH